MKKSYAALMFVLMPFMPVSHHHSAQWRISIPEIGVNATVIGLNASRSGSLPVPSLADAGAVGWYRFSAPPGGQGNSVFVGHVDTYAGLAVFYNLYRLLPGDRIYLTTGPGRAVRYEVLQVKEVPKRRFPAATIFGRTKARRLWLITCGGSFNYATRSYRDNIIVSAAE